jgi:predicted RNA binding protein YcfA (HicA-like mRNA interferase family)
MIDAVVYLSSLPRIADRNRKVEVLQAFASGIRQQGGNVLIQTELKIVDCKLAVILGWVGNKIKGPHIQLRQDVISHQSVNHQHVMPIDASCFKFCDPTSKWLRYSLDGVFYNSNNYANHFSTDQKWQAISQDLGLKLQPWRVSGNHILVCLQRDGGWSMKGTDLQLWAKKTVLTIRQHTDRAIVIRPHPKTQVDLSWIREISGVSISSNPLLTKDLDRAWAAVFYNSSSSVAAVLAGIPVFADDNDCVAWSVANTNLSQIETPCLPTREQWLWNLCAAHWNDTESQQGLIYKKFLEFL